MRSDWRVQVSRVEQTPLCNIERCSASQRGNALGEKPCRPTKDWYHHSIERSNEGGFWAPVNNGIVHILNNGKETFEILLAQVLIDNNMCYLAYLLHPG